MILWRCLTLCITGDQRPTLSSLLQAGPAVLSDAEILRLVAAREIPAYKLETALDDHERGVRVRRKLVTGGLPTEDALHQLPYTHYDYTYVSVKSGKKKDFLLIKPRQKKRALIQTELDI